jgi:alpha-galactosidase
VFLKKLILLYLVPPKMADFRIYSPQGDHAMQTQEFSLLQGDLLQAEENRWLLRGNRIEIRPEFAPQAFYRHGWHSWSLTSWLPIDQPYVRPQPLVHSPQIDDPQLLDVPEWRSVGVLALAAPDGNVLLVGGLDLEARLWLRDGVIHAECPQANAAWFVAWGAEESVFQAYAGQLQPRFGTRRSPQGAPRVWCSWYSFYTDITEENLLANLEGMADYPFEVFQIDDGWQRNVGDWQPNEKFPHGMAALAERIRAAGKQPGLWLAPLITRADAELAREHPEWLLRDETGQPVWAGHNWDTPLYALGTTHPAAMAWLEELIATARAWGYDYLKLDFLYAGALAGKRHQPIGREAALRQALERIRAAAGEDAYLLLCGVPIYPALGIANGLRIGADTAPYLDNRLVTAGMYNYITPSQQNAARTTLHRLWLAPFTDLDPDVAFFRSRFNLMKPEERIFGQALGHICGFKATSDPLFWLDADEQAALRRFWEEDLPVERLGRYRYRVGTQEVDFSPLIPLPAWPLQAGHQR